MRLKQNVSERSLSLHTLDVKEVLTFKEAYQSKIKQPISVIQQLQANKMPQKCFLHSTDYSLYCHIDKRPLCANCVHGYGNKHKAHKVLPLHQSAAPIKNDIQKYSQTISKAKKSTNQKITQLNEQISNADEDLQKIQIQITQFYHSLRGIINQQEKQLLNEIAYHTKKKKCENIVLSGNLRKSVIYLESIVEEYKKASTPNQMLVKRNIFEVLSNTEKLIGIHLGELDPKNQVICFNKQNLTEIQTQFEGKFTEMLSKLTNEKVKENNSFSKTPKNLKIITKNLTPKNKFEQRQLTQSRLKFPPNRHSKSISLLSQH